MKNISIWTDGSYRGSVDIGGIGVVVVYNDTILYQASKRFEQTTCNRMEILAIMNALEWVQEPFDTITIYTDSQYCLGIINYEWHRNKNSKLWEKFDKLLYDVRHKFCPNIRFKYTKGHRKDKYNNLADRLATMASGYRVEEEKEEREGMKRMTIALDFDGTVVKHRYPEIGEDIGAVPVLLALQHNGHQFILHTMRDSHSNERNCLKEASDWFRLHHINIIGVNENPWQKTWTDSKKTFADLYIDDAALGIPLKQDNPDERPHVDWEACIDLFVSKGMLTDMQALCLKGPNL